MVKGASLALAGLGMTCGLISAWYWLLSSRVRPEPAWELDIRGPVDRNIMGHVAGLMIAARKASALNAKAAVWAASTVVLTSASALVGAMASN